MQVLVHLDLEDEYGVSVVDDNGDTEHFSDLIASDMVITRRFHPTYDARTIDLLATAGMLSILVNVGHITPDEFFATADALGIKAFTFV